MFRQQFELLNDTFTCERSKSNSKEFKACLSLLDIRCTVGEDLRVLCKELRRKQSITDSPGPPIDSIDLWSQE